MLENLFCKQGIIHLINCVNRLLILKLRPRYNFLLLCYCNYFFFVKCFVMLYRIHYFKNHIHYFPTNVSTNKLTHFRNLQYNLLDIFYEKLNYFSVFYNIRRKRKQRRSLYVVLAFDRHVCFKNLEREYEQIRFMYSKFKWC